MAQSPKQLPPCGNGFSAQLSFGADADWFSNGKDWSAGPGANSNGQAFWNATVGTATQGYGAKLTAGGSLSFSFSSAAPQQVAPSRVILLVVYLRLRENRFDMATIWIGGKFV